MLGRSSFLLVALLVSAAPGRARAEGAVGICVASPVLEDVADLQLGLGQHLAARGFAVQAGDASLACGNVLLAEDLAGLEARRAEASLSSLLMVRRVASASAGTSSFELWLARAGAPPEARKATTGAERAARLAGLSMALDDLMGSAPVAVAPPPAHTSTASASPIAQPPSAALAPALAQTPQPGAVSAPAIVEAAPPSAASPPSVAPSEVVTSRVDPGLDLEAKRVSVEKETQTVKRGEGGRVEAVETSRVGVSASGDGALGVGISQERVERVKEPVDGSTNFGITLGGGGSFSDLVTIATGSFALRVRHISGQFPGPEGGTLSAFDVAVEAGGMAGVVSVDTSGFAGFGLTRQPVIDYDYQKTGGSGGSSGAGESSDSTAFYGGRGQLELAYLWTRFSAMDPATLKQSGFGFRLGVTGGVQVEGSRGGSVSPTIGPLLGLEFPSYNAGTAHYSAVSFNAMIIPIGGLSAYGSLNITF
jgi:hypothetical protein